MRPGVVVSIIGHVGAVLMTMLAWEASSELPSIGGAVVPVEIVDVALENNVRALREDVPDEEETFSPEEAAQQNPQASPEPTPPRRNNNESDFERWARNQGLGNVDENPTPQRPREGERSDRSQEGQGLGTEERVTIEARAAALVRTHMRRCWRMPIDLPDPDRLRVRVEFQLNRNGTLNGQPRVLSPTNYTFDPYMRTAVDAALRAVRQCDPYPFPDDPTVGEHYEIWRTQIYDFGPRTN